MRSEARDTGSATDASSADPLVAIVGERIPDHPLLWWTRVTAYAAAAICSLLAGVM